MYLPFDLSSSLIDPLTQTVATEGSKMLLENLINKIKSVHESKKIQMNSEDEIKEKFLEYLNQNYEKYSAIPTIALKDRKVMLERIYQPLTLINTSNRNEKIFIENSSSELLSKFSKILIIDSAGMGKSTLSQFMFLSALKQKENIPIFIELRGIKNGQTILDIIYKKFNYFVENFNKEYLLDLIRKGDFIFFFDGYDEIANSEKDRITIELQEFISNAGVNKFIITSRPIRTANFPNFDKFEIQGLIREEAYSLLKKYDYVTGLNLFEPLLNEIEKTSNKYREFLQNPLYCSLIYVTYKRKRELPLTQSEFYKQVYEALYMEHDITKDGVFNREKDSGLSMDQLIKFLSRFAYVCLLKNINDFNGDQFLNLINDTLNKIYFKNSIEPSVLFKDLTENVPLFVRQGVNYKWVHKSFMEYFASLYISVNENKNDILEYIKNSVDIENYENMLNIYADIDQENFDKIFVKPFLHEYLNYSESWDSPKVGNELKIGVFRAKVFISLLKESYLDKIKKEMNLYNDPLLEREEKKNEATAKSKFNKLYFREIEKFLDEEIEHNYNFANFNWIEGTDGGFYCSYYSYDPYTEVLLSLLENKKYEFIVHTDFDSINNVSTLRQLIKRKETTSSLKKLLDYENGRNSILDFNDSNNVKNFELKHSDILAYVVSSSKYIHENFSIDYETAKDYYVMLNSKEEKISDVLNLLI